MDRWLVWTLTPKCKTVKISSESEIVLKINVLLIFLAHRKFCFKKETYFLNKILMTGKRK